MVKAERLNKYGEFFLLDQLVKMYPAYKHSDIFDLSVSEVYTIKIMGMESAYLERQRNEVRTKLNKSKSKVKK